MPYGQAGAGPLGGGASLNHHERAERRMNARTVIAFALVLVLVMPIAQAQVRVTERVLEFSDTHTAVTSADGVIEGNDARQLRMLYDRDHDGTVSAQEVEQAEQDVRSEVEKEDPARHRFDGQPADLWEVLEVRFDDLEGSVTAESAVLLHVQARAGLTQAPADAANHTYEVDVQEQENEVAWTIHSPPGYVITEAQGLQDLALNDGGRSAAGQATGGQVMVLFERDEGGGGAGVGEEQTPAESQEEDSTPGPGLLAALAALGLAATAMRGARRR